MAEEFDIIIAFCDHKLPTTQDTCERKFEFSGDTAWINVLFFKAAEHRVMVRINVGDQSTENGPRDAPKDRSMLLASRLERAAFCSGHESCTVTVSAFVDDNLAAVDRFRFT